MDSTADAAARKAEIQSGYDRVARRYDLLEMVPEVMGVRPLRQNLLQRASGNVLEVAVGTGKNLPYYPPGCRITAIDLSPGMLSVARERAVRLGIPADFLLMEADALDLPNRSFDTVVSTLSTCTFPDPVAALREMARVCRPDGRILLVEHGRSDRPWLGRWQDRTADRHAKALGCYWNREPLDLLRQAGLCVVACRRIFFGIYHQIEATPPVEPPEAVRRNAAPHESGLDGDG